MPKVETYDSPQVQARSVGNVSQRLDSRGAFGEQIGKGVADIGRAAAQIIEKHDNTVARERLTGYRKEATEYVAQYRQTQGRDAYDGQEGMIQGLEDIRKKYAKELSGSQQSKFNALSADYDLNYQSKVNDHAFRGFNDWQVATIDSAIEGAQQDMAAFPSDANIFSRQIKAEVVNKLARQGLSGDKDIVEREQMKALTVGHKSAIDSLLESSPQLAKEYYNKHVDEIAPTVRDDILEDINKHADAGWAMEESDRIRELGGTLTDRLSKVREIDDPAKRKLVQDQVEHDYRLEKAAKQESANEAYNQASLDMEQGASALQWSLDNPDAWEAMTPTQRNSLKSGAKIDSNPMTYYEIKGHIAAGNTEKAGDLIASHLGKDLSNTDAKKLIDQITKPPKARANVLSDKAVFDKAMEELIGKQPSKGEKRKSWNQRYSIMSGLYQQELDDWFENNPNSKNIPAEDRDKILDRLLIKQVEEGFIWDTDHTLGTIPVDDLGQIQEALKAQGYPVTPENIMQLYMSQQ